MSLPSSTELLRCIVDTFGECTCEYVSVLEETVCVASEFDFMAFFFQIIFPCAMVALMTYMAYWGTTKYLNYLIEQDEVDPEEYMDGFGRLFDTEAASKDDYEDDEASGSAQPHPEGTTELEPKSNFSQCVMDGLLDMDAYRQKNRSQYDINLKMTSRQLGDLVRQRITWLMTLDESSKIPDFPRPLTSTAVAIPSASKVVIEDVTGNDIADGGDSDSDVEVELLPKEGVKPSSPATDSDSDSDTGDFCVIPQTWSFR